MKKIVKLILLTIIMILASCNIAMADSTPTLKLETSESTFKQGEEFNVTLSQQDGYAMSGMQFNITYDNTVFELKSKQENSNWSLLSTANANEVAVIPQSSGVKTGTIVVFTFKVLKDTTGSTISLSDIQVADTSSSMVREDINPININIASSNGSSSGSSSSTDVTLSSISVTKDPATTTYTVGDKFNTSGMEVTAEYSNGTKKVITNYTYSPTSNLTLNDKTILISYSENGIVRTATCNITVKAAESSSNSSEGTSSSSDSSSSGTSDATASGSSGSSKSSSDEEESTSSGSSSDSDEDTSSSGESDSNSEDKEESSDSDGTDDELTSESSLPKTGSKLIIVALILAVIGVGLFYYKKYESFKGI